MKMYMVGGAVRDEILGIKSNDIDFSVVLEKSELQNHNGWMDPFETMENILRVQGFELFEQARKPEHLTARGKFPKSHPVYANKAADFVLARKEGTYSDGRRPDSVQVGTLDDDLARRDFTMNAIAKVVREKTGVYYIDPFNGQQDIADRLIRCVGDPMDRFTEDALRALRAIRFAVTKGFRLDSDVFRALFEPEVLDLMVNKISDDRKRGELRKMFQFDTVESIKILSDFKPLTEAIFAGSVSLDATMKTKGRG